MYNIVIETLVNRESEREREQQALQAFLQSFDLTLDTDVEKTFVARRNGELVGTCSIAGKVIKCFAVKSELQGEGLSAMLVTHATNELFEKGIYNSFVFTKPSNREIFIGLGFAEVYAEKDVVLLENGISNVKSNIRRLFVESGLGVEEKGAIVMNCNPFTKGHRFLIEYAARKSETVVLFVVEADKSVFPFADRLELIRAGVADLKNVHVLPGGEYIISSGTFPSYFLKREDDRLTAYTRLDIGIFGKYIAPVFNIKKRYVGEEPIDRVTRCYNEAMFDVLPGYGVEVEKIDRLESDAAAISASEVRRMLRLGNWDRIAELVPETTLAYLRSAKATPVIQRIKEENTI